MIELIETSNMTLAHPHVLMKTKQKSMAVEERRETERKREIEDDISQDRPENIVVFHF